jgi:AraC family transcriptional regulator, regulatory protein of adaptative response / DNA-3-methyladenine glycosylase II
MLPSPDICERARVARDPRFDGRFFVAVLTTGIYCRPVCPARLPARDNVRFYPSAAAAEEAGYRPCRRCRPETSVRVPEWSIRSQTVVRGLRLIEAGDLDDGGVGGLARRLGVSARHLNRLFVDELGATPKSLATARRRALAKRLIDETDLPLSRVALQAGYGSVRRFNDDLRRYYRSSASELRRGRRRAGAGDALVLRLGVRAPYRADWVFAFLARRALAGFETVEGLTYRRRIVDEAGTAHWITVSWDGGALRLNVPAECPVPLAELLPRVRRVFDLDADAAVIDAHLGDDARLAPVVALHPGLRVPGAWDGFETAVRAVLGQQVSVDRATALARALLERYGDGILQSPRALARLNPAEIGMPGKRGEAIRRLAAETAAGRMDLTEGADSERLQAALRALPGIGPWTAGYVAMRVARDPDAHPLDDWVVMKVLADQSGARPLRGRALEQSLAPWRPWRAYAVMYLWKLAELQRAPARRETR